MATMVDGGPLEERNRRTVRILLAIVAVLMLAAFAIGIKW